MELRVLAVGDVVGEGGLQCLEQHLRSLKKLYRIDFCVVNGENASGTAGFVCYCFDAFSTLIYRV